MCTPYPCRSGTVKHVPFFKAILVGQVKLLPHVEPVHRKGHTYLSLRRGIGFRVRRRAIPQAKEFIVAHQAAGWGASTVRRSENFHTKSMCCRAFQFRGIVLERTNIRLYEKKRYDPMQSYRFSVASGQLKVWRGQN